MKDCNCGGNEWNVPHAKWCAVYEAQWHQWTVCIGWTPCSAEEAATLWANGEKVALL